MTNFPWKTQTWEKTQQHFFLGEIILQQGSQLHKLSRNLCQKPSPRYESILVKYQPVNSSQTTQEQKSQCWSTFRISAYGQD